VPLLALLTLALPPVVEAQADSVYYGLSIGELDYSDQAAGLGDFNDSTSSWRVIIAYQFFTHFAFEGIYGKTSAIRDTATFTPLFPAGVPPAELAFETELNKIYGFRALGTVPFDNELSLIAGVGFVYIEQDVALSINGSPFAGGEADRGGQLAYYLGAQYDWDRAALRLSYEKIDFANEAAINFVAADAQEVALSFFYKL
jgi:hypothetical protein